MKTLKAMPNADWPILLLFIWYYYQAVMSMMVWRILPTKMFSL